MKRIALAALSAASIFVLAGCYSAPVMPPPGMIYQDTKSIIDVDAQSTQMSSRSGSAESVSYLGLVALGDCSLTTAAQNGGVSTVNQVDYQFFNVLGIYQKFTTIAYGN
ncbi:MAG: TRL-like family protein [Sumerlaeia bacterium]